MDVKYQHEEKVEGFVFFVCLFDLKHQSFIKIKSKLLA
jgi:hypothetical protein